MNMDFGLIIDVCIVVMFFLYGYNFKFKTPEYKNEKGLRLKRTLQNKQTWEYGHDVGGTAMLVMGVVNAIPLVLQYSGLLAEYELILQYAQWGIGVLCIILILPIINIAIDRKFGKMGK